MLNAEASTHPWRIPRNAMTTATETQADFLNVALLEGVLLTKDGRLRLLQRVSVRKEILRRSSPSSK
jgi:hypothetical protein